MPAPTEIYHRTQGAAGPRLNTRINRFMRPMSKQPFYNKELNWQQKLYHESTKMDPHSATFNFIAHFGQRHHKRKLGTSINTMNNLGHKYKSSLGYIVNNYLKMIDPDRGRLIVDNFAPYHEPLTAKQTHQTKKSFTRHVIDSNFDDAHKIHGNEAFDVAAYDLCASTAARWPALQRAVFRNLEWWVEQPSGGGGDDDDDAAAAAAAAVENSGGGGGGGRPRSDSASASASPLLLDTVAASHADSIDMAAVERKLSRFSSAQAAAAKSRAFALLLQGYSCSGLRDVALEGALLGGVANHIIALHQQKPQHGANVKQVFATLLQSVAIGILRHQSVADFSTLGLGEIARCCHPPSTSNAFLSPAAAQRTSCEKMARAVSLSMKFFVKRDADAAVRIAYLCCIYCAVSPSSVPSSNTTAGVPAIPMCDTKFNSPSTGKLSDELLYAHPPSRPFITLSESWGFDGPALCPRIQSVACAAWLFEMATLALVSLVDAPAPCGAPDRVLRAIELVASACHRWSELMEVHLAGTGGGDSSGKASSGSGSGSTSSSSSSSSIRWSSASIIISLQRLAPVLEKLALVESRTPPPPVANVQLLEAATAVAMRDPTAEDDDAEDDRDDAEHLHRRRRRESIVLPLSRHERPMAPTSFSAESVQIKFADDDDGDEDAASDIEAQHARATDFFAKSLRHSASVCVRALSPYFGLQKLLSESDAGGATTTRHLPRAHVPRYVTAELADAAEFVSSCPIFERDRDAFAAIAEKAQRAALN